MTEKETLTPRQRRFVMALPVCPNMRATAKAAQIAEITAWRYMRLPKIKAALAERQTAMLQQVTSVLVSDMGAARGVLLAVAEDPQATDSARVSAAKGILDTGLRIFELWSLADRVAALEQALERNATP